MKICTLVSGSSGNSTYISDGKTSVLVDVGVTGKKIEEELAGIGVKGEELDAILVTHEHIDHVCGVGVVARKYGIPVYANLATMKWLDSNGYFKRIMPENLIVFENDSDFMCGTLLVHSFSTPHDAIDPVGYRFTSCGVSVAVSTDIGEITENVRKNTLGCAAVVLEANHDVEMLKNGPYPYPLKKRILGDHGHLSNSNSAIFARELAENGTKTIILGHLSNENNTPEIAYKTVESVLGNEKNAPNGCRLLLAPRHSHGEMVIC